MASRTYASPAAFKQALEQRLRAASTNGVDFSRRRQLLVFDRFLARVACTMGDAAVLKGGLVLELRLTRARTTRDVDLRFSGSPAAILDHLQAAGRLDLGDFLTFEVRTDPTHPTIRNEGLPYGGLRHRAEARMAGRLYGQPFAVDVAFGDPIVGAPELLTTPDLLAFAGIAAPTLRVYPIESHIAEKLHAYSMPRKRDNTRVKDLPDLALLGTIRELAGDRLREALDRTFQYRGTHAVPTVLPEPPESWTAVYRRMALEDGLEWRDIRELMTAARAFLDPILGGAMQLRWVPIRWRWEQ
ncbi:MAG: nucleotidyl transferase AbiEii/AbiGii toxin family protein [bacterium]|nr:nucleotidyl transferase AbiEii/AbiGii toxin family protein [bacterium]